EGRGLVVVLLAVFVLVVPVVLVFVVAVVFVLVILISLGLRGALRLTLGPVETGGLPALQEGEGKGHAPPHEVEAPFAARSAQVHGHRCSPPAGDPIRGRSQRHLTGVGRTTDVPRSPG